jgi:hypothetical protein
MKSSIEFGDFPATFDDTGGFVCPANTSPQIVYKEDPCSWPVHAQKIGL